MKTLHRLSSACLCFALLNLSQAQETPRFEDRTYEDANGGQLRYRLYLPEGYEDSDRNYPIVTWLNGSGGMIGSRPQSLVNALRQGEYPGFLIEPANGSPYHTCDGAQRGSRHVHCRPELPYETELLLSAIEEVESIYPIDPTKRVLAGYSAGGVATFNTLRERPDFFSAAVPIASGHEARRFRDPIETRIWALHGHSDSNVLPLFINSTIDAIAQLGSSPIYLEPSGGDEASFRNSFFADHDNELYPWMFDGKEPRLAKLIYDPTDGNVKIDATTAPGGKISQLDLTALDTPAIDRIGTDVIELGQNVIRYEASDGVGFGGVVDLGPFLPAGLSFSEVHESLQSLS